MKTVELTPYSITNMLHADPLISQTLSQRDISLDSVESAFDAIQFYEPPMRTVTLKTRYRSNGDHFEWRIPFIYDAQILRCIIYADGYPFTETDVCYNVRIPHINVDSFLTIGILYIDLTDYVTITSDIWNMYIVDTYDYLFNDNESIITNHQYLLPIRYGETMSDAFKRLSKEVNEYVA